MNNEITPKFRCFSSVLHAVTINDQLHSHILQNFSLLCVWKSYVSTRVSDILHIQCMLDMFSPRKSSFYLNKDPDLGFRTDEVFRSDPFSLHVIEQLIYSLKFLLKINYIFIQIFLYAMSVSYYKDLLDRWKL